MQRNYNKLLYHLIFPTKGRKSMLNTEKLKILRECFHEKEIELGLKVYITNGVEDHVHTLISISPRHSISKIVMHLKGYSSYKISGLSWSRGYSCLTVDQSSFDRIYNYIFKQQEHHKGKTQNEEWECPVTHTLRYG